MRRTLVPLFAASFMLLPVSRAFAQEARFPMPPLELRTSGTAQRPVKPDVATINLDFTALGFTPKEAGVRVAMRADSLRRALQALGIPRDSLVSRSQYGWWQGRLEVIPATGTPGYPGYRDTSFRARDAIQVRLHDLSKVGAVIDSALAHGITQISNVRYDATSLDVPQQAAIEDATRHARRQAEYIASAAGVTLGRLLAITTEPDYTRPYAMNVQSSFSQMRAPMALNMNTNMDMGTTVIEPVMTVSATVVMRWEIINKP